MTKWFKQRNWYSISFWTISVYLSIANYLGDSIPERIISFIASMAILSSIYFLGQWSAQREIAIKQSAEPLDELQVL